MTELPSYWISHRTGNDIFSLDDQIILGHNGEAIHIAGDKLFEIVKKHVESLPVAASVPILKIT